MTAIHEFVIQCQEGTLDRCLGKLKSGWAVMGDPQVREGYCLLYSDPVVSDLNALTAQDRDQFLRDMAMIGDAVLKVTGATRINYEILGNQEPALHAHIIPRSEEEPLEIKARPIWFADWEAAPRFDKTLHQESYDQIKKALGL